MLAADKDVVCGIYPVKGLRLDRVMAQPSGTSPEVAEAASLDYAVKFAPGSTADASGLVEVDYAATGFMDGHSLTRKVKSDPVLSRLPVILFSSLITDSLRHKGEAVGADDQISKPDTLQLVERARALAWERLAEQS